MKTKVLWMVLLFLVPVWGREPLVVAHRGASRDAPDNTIPAFKLAWERGADAIEGDFHLTKDGRIVCIHDRNTRRVSDRRLVVRDTTFAELRKLDVGGKSRAGFTGTVIPTLAEVLATVPDRKRIYIEVKCGKEIVPELLDEVGKSGLKREQIVVISFHKDVIQEVKSKGPQYKAFWLCSFNKKRSGETLPPQEEVLDTLTRIQADGLSSNVAIPESSIAAIKAKGFEWHVWTVDDAATAKRMKGLGVDSITTNVPGEMLLELRD